jgi:hypothetical protein
MPSAIVTTIGAASANSYIDVAAADAYFDDRLDATVWNAAVMPDRTRALLMAANRLEVENWLGNRVTTAQRLAWPRVDVAKVDPVGVGYGGGYHGYGYQFTEVYKSDEIPQPVKDAQCELALAYLEGFPRTVIKELTADGVTVEIEHPVLAGGLPPRVMRLIAGLISGNKLMRS